MATYANPVDLPYRYQAELPYKRLAKGNYREAADPTVITFKGRNWLFASHSSGYWWSDDMLSWHFVKGEGYDVGKFAPTVMVMGGRLYMALSENANSLYVTDDPMSGKWSVAADVTPGYNDPCLFLDDDGRLYMYEGLSGTAALRIHELDPRTFARLRSVEVPQSRDKEHRGWEVPGDRNELTKESSYIEGSWVNKFGGRYYLQYAAPGTQYRTYGDGVLVSDHPMGPFTYQSGSPFAFKPTGFISGAGHGSTFADNRGRLWHMGTMTVSIRHQFERRLGLFPARLDAQGHLLADTYLADYPHYADGKRELTGWMLLSRGANVSASSSLDGFPPSLAADENVRTWWSATTGAAGEWFQMDLGAIKRIDAVQINFADQGAKIIGISQDSYRYRLDVSDDGKVWRALVDQSDKGRDAPHDYHALPQAIRARFVRLTNVHSPDGGMFSLSDLRIFGKGNGAAPTRVTQSQAQRNKADPRRMSVSWTPAQSAQFHIVRLGVRGQPLSQSYQVYDANSIEIASLNAGASYCWAIDAVNENGITRSANMRCEQR